MTVPNENNRLSDHADVRQYKVELGRRIASQSNGAIHDQALATVDAGKCDAELSALSIDGVIDDRIRQDNAGAMYEATTRPDRFEDGY